MSSTSDKGNRDERTAWTPSRREALKTAGVAAASGAVVNIPRALSRDGLAGVARADDVIYSESFESGSVPSDWTVQNGMEVRDADTPAGSYRLQSTTDGGAGAYASHNIGQHISDNQPDKISFLVEPHGNGAGVRLANGQGDYLVNFGLSYDNDDAFWKMNFGDGTTGSEDRESLGFVSGWIEVTLDFTWESSSNSFVKITTDEYNGSGTWESPSYGFGNSSSSDDITDLEVWNMKFDGADSVVRFGSDGGAFTASFDNFRLSTTSTSTPTATPTSTPTSTPTTTNTTTSTNTTDSPDDEGGGAGLIGGASATVIAAGAGAAAYLFSRKDD